jgi:DNA (cytosine-5)-methyltransferase 1
MKQYLDLFSGIGGFALGAYWAGLRFDKHYFSEVEPYAVELYQKRFPESNYLGDIKSVNYSELPKGQWLVTGGFPCQPHSVAGKQQGSKDERDLWPECCRMLRELRPTVALFENVPGLFISDGGQFFNRVLSDISESGYACEWQVISAQDVGAPHLRKRVWIVAYPEFEGLEGHRGNTGQSTLAESGNNGTDVSDTWNSRAIKRKRELQENQQNVSGGDDNRRGKEIIPGREWWATEPSVGRLAHGIPNRVDRLNGLGNAIVPQCAEMIFNLPVFDEWKIRKDK